MSWWWWSRRRWINKSINCNHFLFLFLYIPNVPPLSLAMRKALNFFLRLYPEDTEFHCSSMGTYYNNVFGISLANIRAWDTGNLLLLNNNNGNAVLDDEFPAVVAVLAVRSVIPVNQLSRLELNIYFMHSHRLSGWPRMDERKCFKIPGVYTVVQLKNCSFGYLILKNYCQLRLNSNWYSLRSLLNNLQLSG